MLSGIKNILLKRIGALASKLASLKQKSHSDFVKTACAQDWIRTSTSLRTLRPEHSASTNFATWASCFRAANIGRRYTLEKLKLTQTLTPAKRHSPSAATAACYRASPRLRRFPPSPHTKQPPRYHLPLPGKD